MFKALEVPTYDIKEISANAPTDTKFLRLLDETEVKRVRRMSKMARMAFYKRNKTRETF